MLFAAVNVARKLDVDPELELRAAAKRFRERVESAEALAAADGKDWTTLSLDEQDAYYDRAKEQRMTITDVRGRQVLDSRGNPTVEVEVRLESGAHGRAIVPSGASTGVHEAVELRDGGCAWGGKGVSQAVANVNGELADARPRARRRRPGGPRPRDDRPRRLAEQGPARRERDPRRLARRREGGGRRGRRPALRATSAARRATTLPVPMMNVINGGAHASNSIDLQEFMVVPVGADSFSRGRSASAPRSTTR